MDIILYLSNLQRISLFDVSNKPEVIRGGSRTLVSVRVVIDNALLYIYIYIYIYILYIFIYLYVSMYIQCKLLATPRKVMCPMLLSRAVTEM